MTESALKARMEMELNVVAELLRRAQEQGWAVRGVDDGEEMHGTKTDAEAMDAVFAVDEATIFFKKGIYRGMAFIVLGNDGYDAIADNSTGQDFTAEVMDINPEFS